MYDIRIHKDDNGGYTINHVWVFSYVFSNTAVNYSSILPPISNNQILCPYSSLPSRPGKPLWAAKGYPFPPTSLWRVERTEIKVLPCRPPIHELFRHLSILIPEAYIQIYHTNSVALLCSRGKLICRSRRGISRQSDLGQMLQQGGIAWLGTPIERNGRDMDVRKQCGK